MNVCKRIFAGPPCVLPEGHNGRCWPSIAVEEANRLLSAECGRPVCVYTAKLIWQHGPWVLSWHRRRIGRSPFWLAWPQFRRGIASHVLLKPPAEQRISG